MCHYSFIRPQNEQSEGSMLVPGIYIFIHVQEDDLKVSIAIKLSLEQ